MKRHKKSFSPFSTARNTFSMVCIRRSFLPLILFHCNDCFRLSLIKIKKMVLLRKQRNLPLISLYFTIRYLFPHSLHDRSVPNVAPEALFRIAKKFGNFLINSNSFHCTHFNHHHSIAFRIKSI